MDVIRKRHMDVFKRLHSDEPVYLVIVLEAPIRINQF